MDDYSLTFFGVSGNFDFEMEKKRLIDNLNWFKSIEVQEFTFYKKWEELQDSSLASRFPESGVAKNDIWAPVDLQNEELTIKEILELKPKLVIVSNDDYYEKTWNSLRLYGHTAEFNNTPGRLIKFLLIDDITNKILGFASISSEMSSLKCRDEVIGWPKDVRMKPGGKGTLVNSMQCPCIASTQPFGYNFLGGKLMATMLTTSTVRNDYFNRYNDVLVGLTTTSLYGQSSMYNGLKWWKGVGTSAGKIPIQPSPEFYDIWHAWIKDNLKEEYLKKMTQREGISGPVTSPKLRVMQMIFKSVGVKISDYNHGYQRGCYYSNFYENGYDFLCGKITSDKLKMKPLFEGDSKLILDWWRPKAIERYKRLKLENRLKSDKLFYSNMKGLKYEEAKEKYFGAVGR